MPAARGTELRLLLFAVAIVWCAFLLVDANALARLSFSIVGYGAAFTAVVAAAHLAVRRWAPHADPLILPCTVLLNGPGLVVIHRIDLGLAEQAVQRGKTYSAVAGQQVLWTVVALALFLAVLGFVRDHRVLARYGYLAGLAGIVAVLLPALLPSSLSEANGAKVWIRIGPLSLQPGEFAKLLLIVFAATTLVAKRELFRVAGRKVLGVELPRARDLGPIVLAALGCVAVLAFEKELGASLLFFGIVLVMIYLATERAVWVYAGLTVFAGGCVLAYFLFNHVRQRVANWIDPLATYDQAGGGYQIAQGLFGLGTGGMGGTGLGAGRPDIVPEANSDFITASIGEELGFLGLAAVLMLYLLIALRGMRHALAVRDSFGKLLGGGLAFTVVMQIFVVVGGVTKLIPETGITAPFLSKGGSSLLANYILVALLLRISDAARKPSTTEPVQAVRAPLADAGTVLVKRTR
ncbi:FtsW/RodA/SpoVE family cell cycle protein [Amycolatopsis sp. Poz14]|uniref:FtsW/RodA/SpoVE family cell cycle protein n=1 Tax=Amycolatopsis sp. Poz14 TaxID=1447705 RepID=UPI001EE8F416|nr:FtsW/RodA/SpoVE family cell cycle protein [Amycolatopsis sp. Poz14]MCG3756735.1 FtsW/RodA/SpoVE family cell cycle protein [Amycolatopsis sp. Poz14]